MPYRQLKNKKEIDKLKHDLYSYPSLKKEISKLNDRLITVNHKLLNFPKFKNERSFGGLSAADYKTVLMTEKDRITSKIDDRKKKIEEINQIISLVNKRFHKLFVDHFVYEMSLKEISEATDMSVVRLQRFIDLELERITLLKKGVENR